MKFVTFQPDKKNPIDRNYDFKDPYYDYLGFNPMYMAIFLIIVNFLMFILWSYIMIFSFNEDNRIKYSINFVFLSWSIIGFVIKITDCINSIDNENFKTLFQFLSKFSFFYFLISIIGFIFTYCNSNHVISEIIKRFNNFRNKK